MGNKNNINIKVGYTVDKSGLEEMQSYFQRIANQAAEPANKLKAGLQQAGKTAKTLDGILEKTFNTNLGTLNVTKFNQEMQKSGLTIKQVKADLQGAGEQGSIAFNKMLQAIASTNIQLKQSSKLLDSMFTTFKNTVRYGVSSSIFNNFTNSISKAYEYTKKLNTSLNDIRIVTGKSAQEMDQFAEKANNAAKSLGASTLDMTQSALIYYQQGLSDVEAQARAETTVKVANVTRQKADEVSEQLTAVWNGYKVSAAETELYIDKLAAVAATTASDLEELSTGMSKVASAAASMGVNFDDLTAQISTIVSVTRQAPESVGTALKTIYARIGDLKVDGVDEFGVKLGEVSSQLEVMGIQVLDQEGNMRDMSSIMAEVADKWNTWTEAQKQAAAVAIAGKRQYNNLIALFENWDMYTEALNTSKEAMGTLQKQQDIYMESTQAKLTKLRATWQDLYKSVGDTDTINAFIEGITNLVQVFDNFTDSFGGGLKSIFAFGTIIANIFSKQIVDSVNGAIQRSQVLTHNIESANAQLQAIETGPSTKNTSSPYSVAVNAGTSEQLKLLQEIRAVQGGLSEEQQIQLINSATEIKNLTEKKVLQEEIAKKVAEEALTQDQINQILSATPAEVDIILSEYINTEDRIKNIEKTLEGIFDITTNINNDNSNLDQIYSDLNNHVQSRLNGEQKITQQERIILSNMLKILSSANSQEDALDGINEHIFEILDDMDAFAEKSAVAASAVGKASKESFELKENINNLKQGNEVLLEMGRQANDVALTITTITSSLSTFAMTWSSINSLIQTWNDKEANFGDKITQTLMTLGMTLPMTISAFTKLKAVQDAYVVSQAKTAAMNSLLAETEGIKLAANEAGLFTLELEMKGQKQKVLLTEAEIKSIKGLTVAETEENGVKTLSIIGDGAEIASKTLLSKVITGLIAKTKALNAAILANPFLAIGTAIVGSIALIVNAYKKYNKQQLEAAEATLEENKKKQEEIKINQELAKSYDEIYKKYQEGKASREEVGKVVDQLAEKYHLEGIELAKLTGNYEDLTNQIKEARKEELKDSVKDTVSNEWAASTKIMEAAKDAGHVSTLLGGNGYHAFSTKQLGITAIGEPDDAFIAALKKNSSHIKTYNQYDDAGNKLETSYSLGVSNVEDPKEMLELYQEIQKTVEETKGTTAEQSKGYKEALNILNTLEESIKEFEQIEEIRKQNNLDTAWLAVDIDQIDQDYDLYKEKIGQLRNVFRMNSKDEAEAEKELRKYLSNSTNAYVKFVSNLEFIAKDAKFDAKTLVESLSDDELEYAMSGKINFSELINYDINQILEILKTKMHQIDEEDLTTVVSLRAKITSDKKLTKKEIEESLDEQSQLLKDERYAADFADFDNKSSLEQLELLNNIIADKINLNKEWEQSTKEVYSTMIEQEKVYQEELRSRANDLKVQLSRAYGTEQTEALQLELAKVNAEIDQSNQKIVEFEKNMSQVHFNEVRFDNLIAGIDGVIDEVKTLKSLTDAIGEGWVIAAEKLETFAKNFPELMADQKNYNYLQDGSLHLTEEGQEAFKAQLEIRKQEIILQNESYKKELQITADKKLAEYEYYKNMANHLEKYIKGYEKEAELEGNLKKGLEEYKVRMMNITGAKDEELNKIIQENNNKTANNTIDNVHNMFNAYQQLGAAIQACQTGAPMPSWNDNKASAPTVDTTGHELTFKIDFIEPKLSEEDAKKMKKMAQEAADLAYNEYSTAVSKIVAADGQTNALLANFDNLGTKKKGKDKKQEQFDDEFDRYYDIKKAIDLVNNALDKLSKIQEKLHGKELIQSLKNENNLIKQQAQNYETLYAQQKMELDEVQGTLMGFGAEFDNNGFLTNYAALTASALTQYQNAIAKYNAGKITEEAKNAYEQSYEKMKKYIDKYNSLFYDEMKNTEDKLDEYYRQTMENNLKIWETEIQIKLDTSQAERNWADFLKDINNDFRKIYKNLNIEMDHLMTKAETYSGIGTIETDLQAIHDVMVEIDKINSGQASDMFESISDAQEKLKELDQQLENDAKNMKQLWEDAWNTYLDGIDQTSDKLDFMNERFEKINSELEFQGQLIELLYGDKAYNLMSKLYKAQEVAMQNNTESIKTQANIWKKLWEESGATMDNQVDWTVDQQKYYEKWQEQQGKLNDMVTEYIQLLQKDYMNTIKDTLAQLEKAITGGNTLENIKDQWNKITTYSDKYYDGIEHALEVQKFANKIDADITKTVGIKNQQKLQAIREKEINYLREKKNLTKYDMEAAEARYQIALKEIALEEAQSNKTSMKLVRNEEGNWAYQYMADVDEVAQKQDDLLTSYSDLYKLAGDAYQNNLEELQNLEQEYLDSQQRLKEEEKQFNIDNSQKLIELDAWYQETKNRLVEENELYRQDLQTSGAGALLQVYTQDQEAYKYMMDSEKAMVDALITGFISSYQELEDVCKKNYNNIQEASAIAMGEIRQDWTSSAQQIAATWAADDGQSVMAQITWAHQQMSTATTTYQALVDQCAQQVELDFGPEGVSGAIDGATQETYELQDAIAEMCSSSENYLDSLKNVLGQVEAAWMAQKEQVTAAISEIQRYMKILGQAQQMSAQGYSITGGSGNIGNYDSYGSNKNAGGGNPIEKEQPSTSPYIIVGGDNHGHYPIKIMSTDEKGSPFTSISAAQNFAKNNKFDGGRSLEDDARNGEIWGVKILSQEAWDDYKTGNYPTWGWDAFKTGGYTGEWGEDGKLAMLHQKELVLNAQDTANFLSGISLLRDMVSLNGSIEQSIAAAIGGMAMQLGGVSTGKIGAGNSQAASALAGDTYYVTADFPNANNAEEIRQAIMNLPNIVSQALGRNKI